MRTSVLAAVVAGMVMSTAAFGQYVSVGGDDHDACASNGRVIGLNPQGDNFLAVRAGPGISHAEIDRLAPGTELYVCAGRDDWLGVVYGPGKCGVSSPIVPRVVYSGPCASGWVSRHYVEITAG